MNNKNKEEEIRTILKEDGLLRPSDQFSKHLNNLIVEHFTRKRTEEFRTARWVARVITGSAIIWSIIILWLANPFSTYPVLSFSIAGFVLGVWGLITLSNKTMTANINSIKSLRG